MKCRHCGEESSEASKFCQECGKKLALPPVKPAADLAVIVCNGEQEDGSKCLEEIKATQKFCSNCGQKVDHQLFTDQAKTSLPQTNEDRVHTFDDKMVGKRKQWNYTPPLHENHSKRGKYHTVPTSSELNTTEIAQRSTHKIHNKRKRESTTPDRLVKKQTSLQSVLLSNQSRCDSDTNSLHKESKASVRNEAEKTKPESQPSNENANTDTSETQVTEGGTKTAPPSDEPVNPEVKANKNKTLTIDDGTDSQKEDLKGKQNKKENTEGKLKIFDETENKEKSGIEHGDQIDKSKEGKHTTTGIVDSVDVNKDGDSAAGNKAGLNIVDDSKDTKANKTTSKQTGDQQTDTPKTGKIGDISTVGNTASPVIDNEHMTVKNLDPLTESSTGNFQDQCVFGEAHTWAKDRNGNNTQTEVVGRSSLFDTSIIIKTNKSEEANKTGKEESVDGESNQGDTDNEAPDDETENSTKLSKRQKRNQRRKARKDEENAKNQSERMKDKKQKEQTTATSQESKKTGKAATPKPGEPGNTSNKDPKPGSYNNSGPKTRSKAEVVKVHFHVLVSENFKLDSKERRLILKSDYCGNWSDDKSLDVKRMCDNKPEMILTLDIPRSRITNGRKISYKYCMIREDSKYEYEYYKVDSKTGPGANRTLTIPDKWRQKDEWHQYDGVVERNPGFWKKAVNQIITWNDLKKHAKLTVEIFSSAICNGILNDLNTQDGLDLLECLMYRVRRVYFLENTCWNYEKDFKTDTLECLVKTLLSQPPSEKQTEGEESDNQKEKKLILCLLCVKVVKSMEIQLSEQDAKLLCKHLKIKPDPGKKQCVEITMAKTNFPASMNLKDSFVYIVQHMAEHTRIPLWLYLMPWIHFLSGEAVPYQPMPIDFSHDKQEPVWWGIKDIHKQVDTFKSNYYRWDIGIDKIIDDLLPSFEMDFLLPRTLMTAINLNQLETALNTKEIPIEVCIATLIYFLKTTQQSWSHIYGYGYETYDEEKVKKCASIILQQLQALNYEPKDVEYKSRWKMCMMFSHQLLRQSTQTNRDETMYMCAQICVFCLAMFSRIEQHDDQATSLACINDLTQTIFAWLKYCTKNWDLYMQDNFQLWSHLLAPEQLQSESVRDLWNQNLTDYFFQVLKIEIDVNHRRTANLIRLYCEKTEKFHPALQECLSKIAFQTISNGYTIDYGGLNTEGYKRFGKLLSDMFNTEWYKAIDYAGDKTLKEEIKILHHVLNWKPFLHFLKIRGSLPIEVSIADKDQEKLKLFDEDCVASMVKGVSVVEEVVEQLLDGTINKGTLDLICVPDNRFDEIAAHVMKEKTKTPEFFKKAMKIRQKEMNAFLEQADYMTTFTSLCQLLPNVDREAVDHTLAKQKTIIEHKVEEFCCPAKIETVEDIEGYKPKLCAFQVDPIVIDILPQVHRCNISSTFMKLWGEWGTKAGNQSMSLEEVVQQIWEPVKQSWDHLASQIKSGEISFRTIEKLIGRMYGDDFERMSEEMHRMEVPRDIVNERRKQLQQYRHLETCVKGAKTILKFSQKYKLQGNFEDITTIASYEDNDLEMRYFDANLMNTCKFLGDLTPDRAKCLYQFVECDPLVKWLKESMQKTGLKELKVFVDLAFMSAGDEPINVKRVQCLHSAVTGYAPLIFDLRPEDDYKQLLVKCDLVWKELKANPQLPTQLRDTNRQLDWLKDIKKAHGSVEVTSLVQAEAINACGVYTVGKGAWRNKPDISNKDGLMGVLQLTISEKEGKRQMRNYTFEQLQDLQSRLMLVAGKAEKGNEGVETFTSVFDSIIRLSKMYNKLCSAGCVLFKSWTAQFLCDTKRKACAILEFGDDEDMPKLKALRNETEDLMDIVPKIANYMESCYDEWLKYIKDKRREYLHLNYFTVDQLVILQKELVKCGTDEEPSKLIYPLLSAVKQDCNPKDLIEAMEEAKASIVQAEVNSEVQDCTTEESEEEETDEDLRQKFIDELISSGYEKTLALRALEHVEDPEDLDAGILWCINHQDDEVVEEDTESEQAAAAGGSTGAGQSSFSGWNTDTSSSIQSLISNKIRTIQTPQSADGFKPLSESLNQLWTEFLCSISSNVKDYLSLEHLGLILRCLARRNTFSVNRKMPPGYVEGTPNLLVCPNGDILPMVLSLYMLIKDQPLPQADEVLLCTQQTTVDEVDIFWKRALFGDSRKLHCLASVDLLDYDVSDVAERLLEEYIQSGKYTPQYKLVVICGSDNENRSRIVSSLDNRRRSLLPINMRSIQENLAEKLQVTDTIDGTNPASFLDFNRSSVRLVTSWRAGVGKTLYRSRRDTDLAELNASQRVNVSAGVTIPLQEKTVDMHYVIDTLLKHTPSPGHRHRMLFHLDVAHEVQHGVDYLLFNLLVLGCVMDKTGYVWRKSPSDLYLIETMPLMILGNTQKAGDVQHVHKMLSLLPGMTCRSPQESLNIYDNRKPPDYKESDQLFDDGQFRSSVFQRPFQYLWRYDRGEQLQNIDPYTVQETPAQCLETLLRHCGVRDPSWAELHHFVWFLNTQLKDYETNPFVCAAAAEDLPGFAKFVLRFLIQMSRDFSTRSLNMSEQSPGVQYDPKQQQLQQDEQDIALYQMRRTWESSPHPYLFINHDATFTFLGFNIERATGNMIDQQSGRVLEEAIMAHTLYDSLVRHSVPIQENFDTLQRHEKIMRLCSVMGIEMPHDPDDTYELTTDNVKKIMAIFMRFRCDIPVIIMGETGCGKTRLVKFMCSLQMPPGLPVNNMVLMKVHGGTTDEDIIRKVTEAERLAQANLQAYGNSRMFTVLFFDEANTTEAIGLIKEIMCDKTLKGSKLKLCENLKIVAACNPYRRHSDELIKKLEQAGLGYHVDAEETSDKLGRVPMRRLVYRVQPLPQSLLPLVWDFGQLNTQVEDLYIRQMVRRYIRDGKLPDIPRLIEVVSHILTASQDFMRRQKDECSFVSLRDVDRVLCMMSWFYEQSQNQRTLYDSMDDEIGDMEDESDVEETADDEEGEITEDISDQVETLDDITRSLVLALGVCYHACLKNREQYRRHVARLFMPPCQLPGGADQMEREISCCQDVFLSSVQLEKNIARNMALKENVFMMVVCIELRIPLFLVGKPGSSKSLAKTIVSDAMQGNASRDELFKELKQAQMVSFQCSPLATPDGIVGTFRQCAQFQKDKDLSSFVSIVVLDEVGLAEDSPRMPLKTLHPLLEDGCQGDELAEEHKKVAFIGISNWALDPAKMNRGILVQREVPDLEELENSARGICTEENKEDILDRIKPLIKPMAESYLEVFNKVSKQMREFYGLRDFYSLVKMVYAFTEKSRRDPTWHEMLHAILRNFGGLDQVNPVVSFKEHLYAVKQLDERRRPSDPDCSPKGLIEACLFDINKMQSESRYLLLLTENYGALTILQQEILARQTDIRPITIFGSSFRRDQEYTQVCRNINKIKVCMETGNTVVLLNLENLYESLYDALNQYYVYFGGERYVDLGLGTHRVKCPVHKKFRLIVVAEKQIVYKKFPIPLINRLEKHFLTLSNMLSPQQHDLVKRLEEWAQNFVKQNGATPMHRRNEKAQTSKVGDVFMGYHEDTCAAVVIHVWPADTGRQEEAAHSQQILQDAKELMLWCATPDAVVRLSKSSLPQQEQKLLKSIYQQRQAHDGIAQYLHQMIVENGKKQLFAQVTTHSKLLPSSHRADLSKASGIAPDHIMLLDTLSSFDTEQQFSNKIKSKGFKTDDIMRPCKAENKECMTSLIHYLKPVPMSQFFCQCDDSVSLLVVQCDSGDKNANLVACARYCVMDEYESVRQELKASVHVIFIVQLPRIAGGCFTGFQCGVWHSVHIDDLRVAEEDLPTVGDMEGRSVADLLDTSMTTQQEPMDTDSLQDRQREPNDEPMDWQESDEHGESASSASVDRAPVGNQEDFYTGAAPLDIEDVMISLENVGNRGQTKGPRRGLNVRGLVLSCVQAALAMVKDKQEHSHRTTDRVPLVLGLFHHNTGNQRFLAGICQLIAALLREKEAAQAHVANHWLVEEAAKHENINKAGTFRRSCLQTLETKISPVLAGIIAYLDTNQNLDILYEQQAAWKTELWFAVLNTPTLIPLKYSDLQSPKRHSDLPEVIVRTAGCDGQMYKGQMPFSWLVYKQIDEVLNHTTKPEEYDEETREEKLLELYVSVLGKSKLGKILQQVTDELVMEDVVNSYLEDFVYMLYMVSNKHEHTLVHQSINYVTIQMLEQLPEVQVLHRLVCVHLAYQRLAPRLVYFHAMNCVWPECSSAIVELKQTNPDHYMFKEEEFTYSALCLLIENLHPGRSGLNSAEQRSQWLQKVHRYRQVIEKVLSLHSEDPGRCGAQSLQSIRRASGLWSRVVVVKLFLEHVCTSEDKEAITVKHCMPLWTLLGEETNLKELRSLESVERFLKSCNQRAVKEILGQEEKCCHCETTLEGPPIILPCKDILCDTCVHNIRALGDMVCPKCKKTVPENWTPVRQEQNKGATQKMKDYQKRCNSFFMDVVSQLCFAHNTAPADAVMTKLMQYILCTRQVQGTRARATKELSIFDTGIDPTPVFRSFLLQLLMRTSKETVTANLTLYLEEAETFIERDVTGKESHYVQLSQLIIQCFEDLLLKESVSREGEDLAAATKYLRDARYNIDTDKLDVDKLRGIAEARVGLAIAAKYIAQVVNIEQAQRIDPAVRRLLEAAQIICSELKTRMPRAYLVKYLCRSYGIDTYQTVCRSQQPYLRWIAITNLKNAERVETVDRYVVCGHGYTQVREALTKIIIGEDVQHLVQTLQDLHSTDGYTELYLQLAVHREITNSNLYPVRERKCSEQVIQTIEETLMQSDWLLNKNLLPMLLHNRLGRGHLVVKEGETLNYQGLQCVLVHFICSLSGLPLGRTLMQPLLALAQAPHTCQNAFLPTMPQDDLDEVREALLAARNTPGGGGDNPVFYRCPNGHPYVIGDCGRPAYVGTCKTCGSEIGGQGYQLRPGNQLEQGTDQTATGHILGRAANRGQGPRPERSLNRIHCACVRLLTHLAMYTGMLNNEQGVQSLIKPDIMVGETGEFLWQHLELDVQDIQRATGKSVDEVFLLIHAILHSIMLAYNPGDSAKAEMCQLSSKKGRTDWEQAFSLKFLKPVLQDTDTLLRENNQLVLQDERLGSDPLLCLLYETESQQEEVHPGFLQDIQSSWRYRTPISVNHLQQSLDAHITTLPRTKQKQLAVLQNFLKEDHHLQALRYIPSILKLQRQLCSRYQRKLDKSEAATFKIGQLKRDDASLIDLIKDFTDAWDLIRGDLKNYVCPTDTGGMVVPKEFCTQPVTDDTSIDILLPTTKDIGLCSYALLDFLFRKQNGFLDHYCKATNRSKSSILSISPRDVTASHLISYDPQQDILPLVLANCKYSFQMGQGTKIEYDFTGLEKQLMDRLLFSKSRIIIEGTLQIEQMVYRAEVTNALVFKKLTDKIPQECLNGAVKSQIVSEIRTLPDVCTSLNNLDITISFLTSVGGCPQAQLNEFMVNTLKMETSLLSQKARDESQFKHAQALWLLLSLMKSKHVADHQHSREEMFESIELKYHEELSMELLVEIRQYMRSLSVEKLSQLVEVLHEYIVLVVSVRDNINDEDYVDKSGKQLYGWLYGYIEDLERPSLDLQILDGFPQEVFIRHSSHTWLEAYEILKEKKTGQRH